MSFHPDVDESRQRGVVPGDAQPFEVVEGIPHPLRRETGRHHQFVGGDALIGVGFEQRLADGEQLAAVVLRHVGPGQAPLGVLQWS